MFQGFFENGINCGVFKSSRGMSEGMSGVQDLDILVSRANYNKFCQKMAMAEAIRSVAHPSLKTIGREDWFVPDFENCRYLHLDVHLSIKLGRKFSKVLKFLAYEDIRDWVETRYGLMQVSQKDELAITLSRAAFRHSFLSFRRWVRLKGDWAKEVGALASVDDDQSEDGKNNVIKNIDGPFPGHCFRLRSFHGKTQVRSSDLANLRRLVRARNGVGIVREIQHFVSNYKRASEYYLSRFMNRVAPGSVMDRRHPVSGGMVVAIMGPDGLGKSTQVRRLTEIFSWKFCVSREYLGTGAGPGWVINRWIRALYMRRRANVRSVLSSSSSQQGALPLLLSSKRKVLELCLAGYGILTAWERFAKVKRAHRAAARGFVVICDRWPQNLQAGYLDGPMSNPSGCETSIAGILSRIEKNLYDRIAQMPPTVCLHLVADFEVSAERKPGGIDRQGFDQRIALMERMRTEGSLPCTVVDASNELDHVSKELFRAIWRLM